MKQHLDYFLAGIKSPFAKFLATVAVAALLLPVLLTAISSVIGFTPTNPGIHAWSVGSYSCRNLSQLS